MKLRFNVEDKPKLGQLVVFAFQQLLAILAATIAVPAIIGHGLDMAAALFGAGVGTIVYLLFTKSKSPVFLGSSFAFLSSLFVAVTFGYCGIILGSIFAGVVYVIIAVVVKYIGTGWISKIMPPVVIGPTVALIGLSLAGSAMGDIAKASGATTYNGYNLIAILCGLVAFFVIVICSSQKRFKSMRLIPFILGILSGYFLAAIFSAIGYGANVDYLKIINWSPLISNFVNADGSFVGVTAFLNYPNFALIGAIKELATGKAVIDGATLINGAGVASLALAYIPVALVVFAEHIADHKNLGSIIGRDLVENEPGLSRTLLGDGVGSIAGTIFGMCPNTTYGESVGCVAITRNASISTIWAAAIMAIVCSFLSPLMAILRTIPSCVMGGVCLSLYGFIAVSGLKMLKGIDLGENKNLFVVSAILISGIGGLAIKIPINAAGLIPGSAGAEVIQITAIATALILGIVTNAVLNFLAKKDASSGFVGDDEEEGADANADADDRFSDAQQLIK